MSQSQKFLIFLFLISITFVSINSFALDVQLDRNRLKINDILTIRVVTQGDTKGELDLNPLTQDFDLLNQGEGTTTSIINGQMSQTRHWTIELTPKRAGKLTIPILTLGQEHSRQQTVEVIAQNEPAQDSSAKLFFVTATATIQNPYVQQTFEYKVKVYLQRQPQHAALSEPQADGIILQRLGEDLTKEEFIKGKRYQVIERRYLAIPQRSGDLTITGPRLEAIVRDPKRRDPFTDLDQAFNGNLFQDLPDLGLNNSQQRIIERASDITMTARPQPANAPSPWLPATSVQLAEEWTPNPPTFRVGEPVTRTITLTVTGATAAQLPNLDAGNLDSMQIYPDRPHDEDLTKTTLPTAVRTQKIALIPTQAGHFILPALQLAWWDTVAEQARNAVIPARTIDVSPTPGTTASSIINLQNSQNITTPPVEANPTTTNHNTTIKLKSESLLTSWWPIMALLFAIAWGGTLLWVWRMRQQKNKITPAQQKLHEAPKKLNHKALHAAQKQIANACRANNARAAREALLNWGQIRWPTSAPIGLSELATRLDDPGSAEILNTLDRILYTPAGKTWNGPAAWDLLAPCLTAAAKDLTFSQTNDPLPELYPSLGSIVTSQQTIYTPDSSSGSNSSF